MNNDPYGETVIGWLTLSLARSGCMKIEGTITDEHAILGMIDSARATLVARFKQNREGQIIVPGYDTALTGTDYEKKLIGAIDQLHKARDA